MNCWYSCGVTTWTQPRIAANPLPENDIEKLQEAEVKLKLGVDQRVVLRELGY